MAVSDDQPRDSLRSADDRESAADRTRATDQRPTALAQADPPENNSTIAHRNPDEVAESEPGAVEQWLAREAASGSGGGVDLSEEDRERAREFVESDPELAELATRYSGDTGTEDLELGGVLGVVQRQFFADVQRYRETRREYETAREADQLDRERRLAHDLERRAAAVNRSAERLNRSYAELESGEQDDLRNVTRTVGEVRGNVTAAQGTVRNRTLVRTQLSVGANDSSGSFADPVALSGRLRTAEGEPVAGENVTLVVGEQVRNATTDRAGRFEVDYRPTTAAAGDRVRTVWFLPANDSAYLRSSDTAAFAIEQVTPNVTVANHTGTVRYGEPLAVDGTVRAGGEAVPDVPVAVTVDGVLVDVGLTDRNGSFDAAADLPANVSAGDQRIQVRVALDEANLTANVEADGPTGADGDGAIGADELEQLDADRTDRMDRGPDVGWLSNGSDAPDGPAALAPANAAANVTVEPTATRLSIERVEPLEESAFVTGRLVADDGAPLANQTVTLRVGGTRAGNVTTNDTGAFAATVGLPSNDTDGASVEVAAEFPSPGNLEPARANATVALSEDAGGPPVDPFELGVAGLLGVAAVGVAVWRFRSGGASFGAAARDAGAGGDDPGGQAGGADSAAVFFDAATAALADEQYDAAAAAAYVSVRRRLVAEDGIDQVAGARTHWEFFADCRAAGLPDDRLDDFERLTRTYEQAAFAPDPVSADDAAAAVEVARSFG